MISVLIMTETILMMMKYPVPQMVCTDPYIKPSSSEAKGNCSQDSGVDEASNGDGDGSQCSGNTEEQEEEQFDTDSSSRMESSESEDISKHWVDYKEGHVLER